MIYESTVFLYVLLTFGFSNSLPNNVVDVNTVNQFKALTYLLNQFKARLDSSGRTKM